MPKPKTQPSRYDIIIVRFELSLIIGHHHLGHLPKEQMKIRMHENSLIIIM